MNKLGFASLNLTKTTLCQATHIITSELKSPVLTEMTKLLTSSIYTKLGKLIGLLFFKNNINFQPTTLIESYYWINDELVNYIPNVISRLNIAAFTAFLSASFF